MLSAFSKKRTLNAAIKQTKNAREAKGGMAEQLFLSAYEGYQEVVRDNITLAAALYNWGFALLNHARSVEDNQASKLHADAIDKFNFCLIVEPNHLGAAIDGGVSYMELARIKKLSIKDEMYVLAKKAFENAERIQKGSASFNIACIYGLQKNEVKCLQYLELSKEYGSLPKAEDIMNDEDLLVIHENGWFIKFMERVSIDQQFVSDAANQEDRQIKYDAEGKIIKEETKDLRKFPEIEREGKVYNVHGNVIRTIDKVTVKPKTTQVVVKESIKQDKVQNNDRVALKTGFANENNKIELKSNTVLTKEVLN